jgi:hypothetical protein
LEEKKTKKKDLFKNLKKRRICNGKKVLWKNILSICELKNHFSEKQNVKYFLGLLEKS